MARVPIIKVGETLIATVQDELRDSDALTLQTELSAAVERTGARGVLLDLSAVETVDSFLGRLLGEVAASTRLLGAVTVITGIQPAVAITLVELGLELKGVRTALNPEKGMALLRRLQRLQRLQGEENARLLPARAGSRNGRNDGRR
ncbi:MAG: STAS domain-containing protein [Chloroflexi bacterium]|nr:STAS domain-containing protein [Chloroflexota bacterium]